MPALELDALERIVKAFVSHRLKGQVMHAYPETLPTLLKDAYDIQDMAIESWPDRLAGWKVAGIRPDFQEAIGATRLCGPVFARETRMANARRPEEFGIFDGGFAAIEAEFILEIGRDIDPEGADDTAELAACISAMHAGMETAGSPFAGLNDAGPLAVISDFGNNAGIVLGPAIPGWASRPLEALTSRAIVNGEIVGEGDAARVAGGPLAALAWLVKALEARGRGLSAGDYVSTGMTTGIHHVKVGDRVRLEFCDGIAFETVAVKELGRIES